MFGNVLLSRYKRSKISLEVPWNPHSFANIFERNVTTAGIFEKVEWEVCILLQREEIPF